MEIPSVSYVTTADGYSIAYAVSGSGVPVIFLPVGITHVQLVWRHDRRIMPWLEQLSSSYQLVQYDSRGQGMSSRGLDASHTIEDLELDLEAVIDHLGLGPVILVAYFYKAHVAIRYAVKHPERVAGLVLVSCSISMSAWPLDSLVGLAEHNWEAMLQNWVPSTFTPAERDELIDYFKTCRSQADWLISARAFSSSDVSDMLPLVETPTLVLHPRDFLWLRPEESMKVAAGIAGARFVLLDGVLPMGEASQGTEFVRRFIDEIGLSRAAPIESTVREQKPGLEAVSRAAANEARYSPHTTLTERQTEVLQLIAEGRTNKEIARSLSISLRTVERHAGDVYRRLGVRNRSEATRFLLAHQELF